MFLDHTPGPWAAGHPYGWVRNINGVGICRMPAASAENRALRAAQARRIACDSALIGAAPDLLRALTELLTQVEDYHAGVAAHGMPITFRDHPWHDVVMSARSALELVRVMAEAPR